MCKVYNLYTEYTPAHANNFEVPSLVSIHACRLVGIVQVPLPISGTGSLQLLVRVICHSVVSESPDTPGRTIYSECVYVEVDESWNYLRLPTIGIASPYDFMATVLNRQAT